MSLFNWLSNSKAKAQAGGVGTARADAARSAPVADGSQRKNERMARRELLYSVVRESMARAGVLSSSYKFKVLSLDAAGRQFLVMIDLASSERIEADLLSDIESVIAQRAKTRHELTVSAVYWRRDDQVGLGASRPAARAQARSATPNGPSQPADLASEPAPLEPPTPLPARAPGAAFDPIQDDEMEAFRAALANGIGSAPSVAPTPNRAARGGRRTPAPDEAGPATEIMPPASGFPDTQHRDDEPRAGRTLSSTQAGDLN